MKKLVIVIGTILAFLLVFGFNCYAQENAIYGCKQKNDGQLRIVSNPGACRPSETPISWNVTGPQGPPGESAPQSPQAQGGKVPSVYDANEQFLGILPSTADGYLSVFIPALSKFIFLSGVDGDVSPYYPGVYLYFDGSNCSGNPYLDLNMRYEVFKLESKYYAADDVLPIPVDILSISDPGWGAGRGCSDAVLPSYPVLPYKEVILPFNMPVALPLTFK